MTHSRSALADIGVIMKVRDTGRDGAIYESERATGLRRPFNPGRVGATEERPNPGGHAETCYSVAEGRTEIRPTLRIVQGARRGGKAGESHAGLRVECGNGASEGWARH